MLKTRMAETGLPARLLPAALWYALIFWFSSRDAVSSGGQSNVLMTRLLDAVSPAFSASVPEVRAFAMEALSFPVRKSAHMFLYFMLALLLLYALARLKRRGWMIALAACGLLAALDEYHQTFVPGRSGEARDVLVDLCGSAIALTLWALARWSRRRSVSPVRLALPPLLAVGTALASPQWAGPVSAVLAELFVVGFPDGGAALLAGAAPIFLDAAGASACGFLGVSAWAAGQLSGRPRLPASLAALAGAAVPAALLAGFLWTFPPLTAALLAAAGWALAGALWGLAALCSR